MVSTGERGRSLAIAIANSGRRSATAAIAIASSSCSTSARSSGRSSSTATAPATPASSERSGRDEAYRYSHRTYRSAASLTAMGTSLPRRGLMPRPSPARSAGGYAPGGAFCRAYSGGRAWRCGGTLAETTVDERLTWLTAVARRVTDETPSVRTIELVVPGWPGHRAGQHLDVRLTAEDGYQAERSYSIASAPGEPLSITVERLDDGEVSPYLTEELRAGDELELRGPSAATSCGTRATIPARCCWPPEGRGSSRS